MVHIEAKGLFWALANPARNQQLMSNPKCLGRRYCSQYQTKATVYLELAKDPGSLRHLEVHYGNGRKPFRAGIPDDWSEADVVRHVMVEDDAGNG
jgi:hypothetical protein